MVARICLALQTRRRSSLVKARWYEGRAAWLAAGVVFGLGLSIYWPHEEAQATAVDRSEKIVLCSVNTGDSTSDAVFVLDLVTGRLIGAGYTTQANGITQTWARNLAADFQVGDNAEYVMVPGRFVIQQQGGGDIPANGGVYVAELNTGMVHMYGFPYQESRVQPTKPLVLIAKFPFRSVQE
jgi:hypothetical protein